MADEYYRGFCCRVCKARVAFGKFLGIADTTKKCAACSTKYSDDNIEFIRTCLCDDEDGICDVFGKRIRGWYPDELNSKPASYRLGRVVSEESRMAAKALLLESSAEVSLSEQEKEEDLTTTPKPSSDDNTALGKGKEVLIEPSQQKEVSLATILDRAPSEIQTEGVSQPPQPNVLKIQPVDQLQMLTEQVASLQEYMAELGRVVASLGKTEAEPVVAATVNPVVRPSPAEGRGTTNDWKDNLKNVKLEKFKGDGKEAVVWLNTAATILGMNRIPEREWVRIVFSYLDGKAMELAVDAKVSSTCHTFSDFRDWMMRIWPASQSQLSDALATLIRLEWDGKSDISDFTTKFQSLATKAGITEQAKLQIFCKNVPYETYGRDLAVMKPQSLSHAIGELRSLFDRQADKGSQRKPVQVAAAVGQKEESKPPNRDTKRSGQQSQKEKQKPKVCPLCASTGHSWVQCRKDAASDEARKIQAEFRRKKAS